jgi:hypothetical protein
MSMATRGLDLFLRAEEEANRLVEELRRLKDEVLSYKTAREALGQAAMGVSELSTRCAKIAEQLGGLAETLRSIGTPELLRGLEAIAAEQGMLRKELEQRHEAQRQEVLAVQENLGAQAAGTKALVTTVRNLALGSFGLSLITLALLGWLVLTLGRG